jgi:hypothetical protein
MITTITFTQEYTVRVCLLKSVQHQDNLDQYFRFKSETELFDKVIKIHEKDNAYISFKIIKLYFDCILIFITDNK